MRAHITKTWILLSMVVACGGSTADAPDSLAATGLWASGTSGELAEGVWEVEPQWPLWSDGATKRRWIYLPPGAQIDSSNMDDWVFPVGTKAWKEFTRDGVRVETRLLEKLAAGQWSMMAYAWSADQSRAEAVPDGVTNALGTDHDIPDTEQCDSCHRGMADTLIGVSAIQLDHGGTGMSLPSLDGYDLLSHSPAGSFPLPGNEVAHNALGYLHANCGNCHNARNEHNPLRLRLLTGALSAVETTPTYISTVDVGSNADPLSGTSATVLIAPGDPAGSLLHVRMLRRGQGGMPALGSEVVDGAGSAAVAAWITALSASE